MKCWRLALDCLPSLEVAVEEEAEEVVEAEVVVEEKRRQRRKKKLLKKKPLPQLTCSAEVMVAIINYHLHNSVVREVICAVLMSDSENKLFHLILQ
ncbi:hypothetical protein HJC23_012788 [Cyclotella cryptica]|uniref:Uncharacterized protein n=1 Tax=Cyclotella cryptica TaxID=29204 RepID=A0ABD3Q3I6_9STRA|eukprot:CCRYP_009016-RA/>CCRYP_009016-RA protein AED:0.02 eAED:0.02 QI:386/1/1/1/1/1/2/1012/95